MEKMWAGRTGGILDDIADDFNSSIKTDSRMYKQDIKGSMAHAAMLGAKGIISEEDADKIIAGLESILKDIDDSKLAIDETCEDIHMFVESELTKRIGDAGKRLHTARSRNDQVAFDMRMYMRDSAGEIKDLLISLIDVLRVRAEENIDTIMPGYTHLQRAQPISFAHHLLAYAMMFARDVTRLADAVKRMNVSPLGACALAGTTYDTDRRMTASAAGFDGVTKNSIDSVSDRDFCVELLSCFSIIMMHLSRFSEEIVLWSSWEFKFIELDDRYSTGSSIMPQKKNPDMAELVRGKTGRVYGDLMAMLATMKSLPLAYNKDMQEDKEATFDALDTVKMCLKVFTPMIKTMKVCGDNMYKAAQNGFICATDLADYLTKRGVPFRAAYKTVGQIVSYCIENSLTLDSMPLSDYKKFSDIFKEDLYGEIDPLVCVKKRLSEGGTAPDSVREQIKFIEGFLKEQA